MHSSLTKLILNIMMSPCRRLMTKLFFTSSFCTHILYSYEFMVFQDFIIQTERMQVRQRLCEISLLNDPDLTLNVQHYFSKWRKQFHYSVYNFSTFSQQTQSLSSSSTKKCFLRTAFIYTQYRRYLEMRCYYEKNKDERTVAVYP